MIAIKISGSVVIVVSFLFISALVIGMMMGGPSIAELVLRGDLP